MSWSPTSLGSTGQSSQLTRGNVPDTGTDIARNRALWTVVNAQFTDEDAHRAWAAKEPT
jgi:hypothetical protein